ncbi:PREDICTED: uncharacterized protein LOC105558792 isoform X2 [Vollenhovia emeryi]|uniref:uncharacterized protein LOC105558792 isoform X2 n=1 Tax=Vollenhovia emeryi TaxID=411798 RepID=UPI0005F385ED|nr:PREDICTED: uncharacterized protein LOC105558792 isoform X2 [Vollenhovia emeryi]
MSRLGTYELTHPESLSEHQLREILKNSCIEILKFEKLCRSELLEMYKRVAMPLPQRQRGGAKSSSTVDMIVEKSIMAVNDDDSLVADFNKGNKRISSHLQTDKSKAPLNDQRPANKKIRLCSTPKVEMIECNGIYKRSGEEQSEVYMS